MKYEKQELFEKEPTIWDKEWQGMPEYTIENERPFKEIKVKFRNAEDYKTFMNLIKQPLTMKTISVWFPMFEKTSRREWRYVNEEK